MTNDMYNQEQEIGNSALDVLIKQFGNRFDFVRELVQNSLDSGTAEVEVWTAYYPGEADGVCEIHVDDNGMGMDERTIDESLTRLFSSTKEDDLTSIGKFGIGFVSVFAPDPDGVLVKTAKGGERWEVFFDKAHHVEKTWLDEPIEGTKIAVFKSMSRGEYQETVSQVVSMLKYWCRYAERRIWFRDTANPGQGEEAAEGAEPQGRRRRRQEQGGQIVNERMMVPGDFPIQVKKGEAEIVMAFDDVPLYGFYNRGLTLKETDRPEVLGWAAPFFRNVSFRIKSPHLEHTLTRDTILMDGNYQKALLMLVDAARGDLVENLLATLEHTAASSPVNGAMPDEYLRALRWLFELNRELDPVFGIGGAARDAVDNITENICRAAATVFRVDRDIRPDQKSIDAAKRKLFRRCHGGPCTLDEIQKSIAATQHRLILSDRENEMTEELFRFEKPVYFAPKEGDAYRFFSLHLGMDAPNEWKDEKVFAVGDHLWLVERLKNRDLDARELALFNRLSEMGHAAGFSLVPVNFLGDNPEQFNLGGELVDKRIAASQTHLGLKPKSVAVDIRGRLFQKLSNMLENTRERDVAVLLAAGIATEWCGSDGQAEIAMRQAAAEGLL